MSERLRLLLIDDDPSMVRLLSKVIQRTFGDKIDLVDLVDSVEAKNWIDNNSPDIVLTDLDMPLVNGLEILRCTKRRNACAQVLLLTGKSTTTDLLAALEEGAVDYLLKPVDQDELTELLSQATKRVFRWKAAFFNTIQQTRESAK